MNSFPQDMIFSLYQIRSAAGDFEGNARRILDACLKAAAQGYRGLAAPAFCLGGYAPAYLRTRKDFLRKEQEAVHFLRKHMPEDFLLIFGSFCGEGRKIELAGAAFEADGSFFYAGMRIQALFADELLKREAEILRSDRDTDLFIILDDAVYTAGGNGKRDLCLKRAAEKAPVLYVNSAGGQNGLIFEGQSQWISRRGDFKREADFSEKLISVKPFGSGGCGDENCVVPEEEFLRQALICGVRDFVRDAGFSRVHLGLSGGIDSALVCAVAVEALGAENVSGILMSSRYSSEGSVKDALALAENLGIKTLRIGIEEMHRLGREVLGRHFSVEGLTDENLQARLRGLFLMAYSNSERSLLLNTGNKSELAVGYSTLYGDSCGALAVIGDLWKTQVYRVSRYINTRAGREIIPDAVLTKAPSAELRPNQKDRDSLPDYAVLDDILEAYLTGEEEALSEKVCDKDTRERLIKMFHAGAYKRGQAAPVIRLTDTAFGFEEFNFGNR